MSPIEIAINSVDQSHLNSRQKSALESFAAWFQEYFFFFFNEKCENRKIRKNRKKLKMTHLMFSRGTKEIKLRNYWKSKKNKILWSLCFWIFVVFLVVFFTAVDVAAAAVVVVQLLLSMKLYLVLFFVHWSSAIFRFFFNSKHMCVKWKANWKEKHQFRETRINKIISRKNIQKGGEIISTQFRCSFLAHFSFNAKNVVVQRICESIDFLVFFLSQNAIFQFARVESKLIEFAGEARKSEKQNMSSHF